VQTALSWPHCETASCWRPTSRNRMVTAWSLSVLDVHSTGDEGFSPPRPLGLQLGRCGKSDLQWGRLPGLSLALPLGVGGWAHTSGLELGDSWNLMRATRRSLGSARLEGRQCKSCPPIQCCAPPLPVSPIIELHLEAVRGGGMREACRCNITFLFVGGQRG
jgi:hypothetical protein